MSQLAQYLLDNEYEIMSLQSTAVNAPPPIVQRAQFIKKQLEETKTLTANLENRDAEIKQLKLAAKMKQIELSEMQIRKDLAEKKLSVLQNDHEINTEKLQRKYDETMQLLKKYERGVHGDNFRLIVLSFQEGERIRRNDGPSAE